MSGAVVSLHVLNGSDAAPRTRIEISGTAGELVIAAEGGRAGVQMGDLRIAGVDGPQGGPVHGNVAQLYARLAADIGFATSTVPSFAHAERLHRLLDTVQAASDSGRQLHVPV